MCKNDYYGIIIIEKIGHNLETKQRNMSWLDCFIVQIFD